ncbi:MAG: putative molybdenum carrier protein [Actinomycetia bacterium]|nr:putative molybdenum carrier protein [Actinomycetes bacterium]
MKRIAFIRSGGQTGVDRGAHDAALHAGVPIVGWCPKCGLAEDLPDAPGLLAQYPQLVETPSDGYEQRTLWNVRDSHATLIIIPAADWESLGTTMTIVEAQHLERPLYIATPDNYKGVKRWLEGLGYEITLNVAGPRESLSPGVYQSAFDLITKLLTHDK